MKYKNYLGCLVLTIIGAANAAMALDCTQRPTCEELGYTSTPDECVDGKMAKCPWDYNAVFCRKKSKVNADLSVNCEVGSILYSDLKCYKTFPDGVVPIGVVFNTEDRVAFAIKDSAASSAWGAYPRPDALIQCAKDYTCDDDGKNNTKVIVDFYGSNTNYAALRCYNYTTEGTQKGDWFLPSRDEILGWKTRGAVLEGLIYSGGELFNKYNYYATSSLSSGGGIYGFSVANSIGSFAGYVYYINDTKSSFYVRCAINY